MTDDEPRPRRPRGPGPAVLLVGLYAALFIAALFYLRARARSSGVSPAGDAGSAAVAPPPSRAALLEAPRLSPASRAEYFQRLAADCCSCGCDLTLRDCLVSDESCVESPGIAAALLRELE